jgi:hypothetical protein
MAPTPGRALPRSIEPGPYGATRCRTAIADPDEKYVDANQWLPEAFGIVPAGVAEVPVMTAHMAPPGRAVSRLPSAGSGVSFRDVVAGAGQGRLELPGCALTGRHKDAVPRAHALIVDHPIRAQKNRWKSSARARAAFPSGSDASLHRIHDAVAVSRADVTLAAAILSGLADRTPYCIGPKIGIDFRKARCSRFNSLERPSCVR